MIEKGALIAEKEKKDNHIMEEAKKDLISKENLSD